MGHRSTPNRRVDDDATHSSFVAGVLLPAGDDGGFIPILPGSATSPSIAVKELLIFETDADDLALPNRPFVFSHTLQLVFVRTSTSRQLSPFCDVFDGGAAVGCAFCFRVTNKNRLDGC